MKSVDTRKGKIDEKPHKASFIGEMCKNFLRLSIFRKLGGLKQTEYPGQEHRKYSNSISKLLVLVEVST